MKPLVVGLAGLLLFLAACGEPMGLDMASKAAPRQAQGLLAEEADALPQRKLIRTAEIDLLVDNAEAASDRVSQLARTFGGFVSESSMHTRGHRTGAHLVLRIPVAKFDEAIVALKGLAHEVSRVDIAAEDVTDRYVDIEARRRSLELTESELEKLLAESRTQQRSADEIVAIYKQLSEIRTQREQAQGQQQALDNRIALTTIRVGLYLDREALAAARPAWKPLDAVQSSCAALVRVLKALAEAAIFALIVVLPLALLLALPLWWFVRRWRRGRAA
ncbi:MAG: DUF4349 domain-containing protein [Planctomycetes bacterium]|nr:DUF4349 domain-containing protein [Planctomycetota bacterium]